MRVLIVRLGSMGDVLHALPAVAVLRATHPDAHIGWAIERRWTPFLSSKQTDACATLTGFERVGNQKSDSGWPTLAGVARVGNRSPQQPLVDCVHIVDTLGWRRAPLSDATWSDIRHTFRDLRAERYDLAIDFQGSIKSAVVAQFSGASSRIGFTQPREKPATMFYTHLVQPIARHIIDQNLSLISPLCPPVPSVVNGFPSCTFVSSVVDVLPSDPIAEAAVDRGLSRPASSDQRPPTHFALLNPGAGWPAKQWPAPRYAEVARALRDDGIFSLVNYGPGEESLAREVEAASHGAARPISCTLPELIALTRRASLFIGGDTGPMHLAALLGVPVVALFGPTDPARNGPYCFPNKNQKSKIENDLGPTLAGVARVGSTIVLRHPFSRTTHTHSLAPDPGLLQITAENVLTAARQLVTREPKAESREPKL